MEIVDREKTAHFKLDSPYTDDRLRLFSRLLFVKHHYLQNDQTKADVEDSLAKPKSGDRHHVAAKDGLKQGNLLPCSTF